MSEPIQPPRPPVTTWVETEQDRMKRDRAAKMKKAVDSMCNQLKHEGVTDIEILLFRGEAETFDELDLYAATHIFWHSRRQTRASRRRELFAFLIGGSLLVLFMPQYFIAVVAIWIAAITWYFSKPRNLPVRGITAAIMCFGGGATLLHAAYNLIFG